MAFRREFPRATADWGVHVEDSLDGSCVSGSVRTPVRVRTRGPWRALTIPAQSCFVDERRRSADPDRRRHSALNAGGPIGAAFLSKPVRRTHPHGGQEAIPNAPQVPRAADRPEAASKHLRPSPSRGSLSPSGMGSAACNSHMKEMFLISGVAAFIREKSTSSVAMSCVPSSHDDYEPDFDAWK